MLKRKLWRTMGQYKSQFISMIVMILLGVGVFVGFNIEWLAIENNTDKFFSDTHMASYRLVRETGFTAEEKDKIDAIDGVDRASRFISVNSEVDGFGGDTVALTVAENEGVSDFVVIEGDNYDSSSTDGIWLSKAYAENNDVKTGDELSFICNNVKLTGKVKGLVMSGEYMICVRDETQIMPDLKSHGYAYISPQMYTQAMGMDFYTQINVLSDMDKEEFSEKADKALSETVLIVPKEDVLSYSGAQGEAEEGKTMGLIIPVLFLAIAFLTMVTTMHRLTAKEKTQIGTLKALGFKDRRILRHYTSYALFIGVVGTALGIGFGFLIGWYIMNPDGPMGTYFDMPEWKLSMPVFCYIVLAGIIVLLTVIGFLSAKKMLSGTAADALRPYSPKKMKPMFIERFGFFHKLTFGIRWNLRDVVRHKSRTGMSILGVLGCVMIIVAVFGMKNTLDSFLSLYYDEAIQYESRIYLKEGTDNEKCIELSDKYNGDSSRSVSIQIEGEAVSLDIYDINHELVKLIDVDGEQLSIDFDGAYVCKRIADEYDVKAGDTITVNPYGTDDKLELKVKGIMRSTVKGIAITRDYGESLGISYTPDSIYTTVKKDDISSDDNIKSVQSKEKLMESFDSFMGVFYTMIFMFIGGGIILGVVVLYNLGVMSYTERYREMATLKVLGFKDKKIRNLLISQNFWVSVAGIVIGIPAGYVILDYLMTALTPEYELRLTVNVSTYIITALLTFGMTLLVSLMVSAKNKKIDMVEALKGTE